MKLAIALVAFAALASCSIRHASEQYACDDSNPCEGGRVCDNGFCIVAGSIDAPKTPTDARPPDGGNAGCPPGCTTCSVQQKTCTINCQAGGCQNMVTCPAGYQCDILCNADNSCRNGVNCQMATSCSIECSGKSSCQNVVCGTGECDVACSGVQSCRAVSCSNSCACDVTCTGNQACEGIQCTSLACRSTTGRGCTSEPAFCDSCP